MTVQELVNLLTSDGIDPDWYIDVIAHGAIDELYIRQAEAEIQMPENNRIVLAFH